MLLEYIGYSATAPGSGAAAAAVSGDSLTVRNARAGSDIRLVAVIGCNQGAGYHQITGPSMHDTTRGLRVRVAPGEARDRLLARVGQRLYPSDTLSVEIAGSAVAGDIENGALGVWYEDMPGISARLIGAEELRRRGGQLLSIYCTIAAGTSGGWSGAEAITAESDLLRAQTDYAVLGAVNSVECCALGIRAPDWGNVRIAVPGHDLDTLSTADYLVRMAERTGLPCVPVFNSGNKNSVMVDALQDENGGDPVVSWLLQELVA